MSKRIKSHIPKSRLTYTLLRDIADCLYSGMGHNELSEVCDIHRTTWYKWRMKALNHPTQQIFKDLAEILRCHEDAKRDDQLERMERIGMARQIKTETRIIQDEKFVGFDDNDQPIFEIVGQRKIKSVIELPPDWRVLEALEKIRQIESGKMITPERLPTPEVYDLQLNFIPPSDEVIPESKQLTETTE